MYKRGMYCAGGEVSKCRDRLSKFCVGDGLDIGCGGHETDTRFYLENKICPTAIGVDLAKTNLVGKADNLFWFVNGCMDYIFSSHLLEHLIFPRLALREWFRVLKPGGFLVMYLPLEGAYPSVGTEGANSDHVSDLNPDKVLMWLTKEELTFNIVKIETQTDTNEYSFDFVVRKI